MTNRPEDRSVPSSRQARLGELLREASNAVKLGDHSRALTIAEQALKERLEHPYLLRMSAWSRWSKGNFEEGGALLNRAFALAPRNPETIFEIGRMLMAEGRIDEGLKAFDDTTALAPGFADAWYEKACALELNEDFDKAELAYKRAHELRQDWAPPLAGLSAIAGRRGQNDLARNFAKQSLEHDQSDPVATCCLAAIELEEREFEAARARLQPLLDKASLIKSQRSTALELIADALDGLGRQPEAYRAYQEMNSLFLEANAPHFGPGGAVEDHFLFVKRLSESFGSQAPTIWQTGSSDVSKSPVRQHAFVLGYFRSGNTLLKTILASAKDVRTLEEKPTFQAADLAFLERGTKLEALAWTDETELSRLQNAYWSQVRELVPDIQGKVLVDMAPLNSLKLPVISRLFPQSRIVLCRRDPCDVVLSCFTRNFAATSATYQLTSLESAARHYDAVMQLTEAFLERLPLVVQVVRYEELVTDFDAVTRNLADFVGIEWTPAMRRFDVTARSIGSSTASMQQVRTELFDGRGKWRHYSAQFEPILPILEPWRKRYGYL